MTFPLSPSIGDTHTEEDTLWTYGSTGWYRTVIGSANDTDYTFGPALGSLNDVDLDPPPSDGDALVYDQASDSWVAGPAGAAAAGSANEIQYNDGAGGLAASSDLTWDDTGKELGVGGDINLDDGGANTLTLQTVTPTAARTISFPDATGTVGLVAGSSGQLLYNASGANAGASTLTYDGSILTSSGRFINSYNAAGIASAPAKSFTGTWYTGGTATTTKPHLLIEPTGATSTAWSTSGTGLGVNAASGFAGNLLDLQVNGTSFFNVSGAGATTGASFIPTGSTVPANGVYLPGANRLGIATNSTARLEVDASGRLLVGTSNTTSFFDGRISALSGGSVASFRCTGVFNALPVSVWHEAATGNNLFIDFGTEVTRAGRGSIFYDRTANGLGINGVTNLVLSTGLVERLRITNAGVLQVADAGNITVGTTTGTKIGTATTQKLGFFNATPVVQPTAVANITTTATVGSLPTPDGTVTIADAATPTVTELLEYCVELESKLEAALGHLRTLGLIAT